jgi:hypothetical protein
MSAASIETVTRMLESLPESAQDRVLEHLREYIETLADELQWNESFEKTQAQLAEAARRAREEIASGHGKPMDYDQL